MKLAVLASLLIFCILLGCAPKAPAAPEQNITANETAPVGPTQPVVQNSTAAPPQNAVHQAAGTTADVVVALQPKNGDTDPSIASMNISVREVDFLPDNSTLWTKVVGQRTYPDLTSTDAFQLGLNTVPAQKYKSVRFQFSTTGDAIKDGKMAEFTLPYEYIQFDQAFEVAPDATLTLLFTLDVAQSLTDSNGSFTLKPQGTLSLLSDAKVDVKGGGKVGISGGTSLFSITKAFQDLLPAGTADKIVASCKKACPDTCAFKAEDCVKACKSSINDGCNMGGSGCRDKCDPYLPPYECKPKCEEDTSSCIYDLAGLCESNCDTTVTAPCVSTCEAGCTAP